MKRNVILWLIIVSLYCFNVASAQNKLPDTVWYWKNQGDYLGWKPVNFVKTEVLKGVFSGLSHRDSQLLSPELNIDANLWPDVEFRLKSNVSGNGQIFFRRDNEAMSASRQVNFSIKADNQFHTYKVNLSSHKEWKGNIKQIRFDPLDPANAQIEVEYFRFLPRNTGGIISNGNFEMYGGSDSYNLPTDWQFKDINPTVVKGKSLTRALQLNTNDNPGLIKSARFEFLRTGNYQLSASFVNSLNNPKISVGIHYYDVFHRPLKPEPFAVDLPFSANWETFKTSFVVPESAAYGQLVFNLSSSSQFTIDDVALHPLPATPRTIHSWEEAWRAYWIVAPEGNTQPEAPRYFRRELIIPETKNISSAKLQVTADDTARVFINGNELAAGENWDNWRIADIYDIKQYLNNGTNVIGIITKNLSGSEGLIAEVDVLSPDGNINLLTDKTWLSAVGNIAPNWSESTFEASNWKPSQELGMVPREPWGDIPYVYHGRKTLIKIQNIHMPTLAVLGQKINLNFEFIPQQRINFPVGIKIQLLPFESKPDVKPYNLESIPLGEVNWPEGKLVRLNQTVQLPRYFQPGEYYLRASITFTDNIQDGITNQSKIYLSLPEGISTPATKVVYLPGNIPAFEINGKTIPVMNTMTIGVASDGVKKDIITYNQESNVNLIWLSIDKGFEWKPDAPATFSAVDEAIISVLEANPQAYIVLNVPIDPVYNPGMRNWSDLYPDELAQNDKGETNFAGYADVTVKGQSYASTIWQKDAEKSWTELIRHVHSSSYADRIIGYVPISGISWEWFYWGSQTEEFVDYSKPFIKAFATWSKKQYRGDLAMLNRVWNTSYKSFDEIQLPSKAQRMAAGHGMFLDPRQDGPSIDLREFFNHIISESILSFCRIVKEETKGNAIVGTYYGYVMHIGRAYFGAHSGHFALEKVLSSPDIDFVMSPSRYLDRGLGGSSGFMTTVDSVKLHGKLYVNQSDIRTFRARGSSLQYLTTLKDSASVLKREFSQAIINGAATQYYDFGKGWTTGDKRLMQLVGKMYQIESDLQSVSRDTIDPENSIAVITSEKSILYTKIDSNIQDSANTQQINQLNRTGVAWDAYLLSDLPKLGNYRYFLFLNCYDITDEQKKYINDHLKKNGNVLVWVNAAGIINRDDKRTFAQAQYDPSRVSEITGFQLKQLPDGPLATRILDTNHILRKDIDIESAYGNSRVSGTRFAAQDGVGIGRFSNNNEVSLAVKQFENWTSIYSAAPTLSAALLRNIARLAEVPIINEVNDDITYASQKLLAVHSLAGGERTFHVSDEYKNAKELFTEQSYVVENGVLKINVPQGETMLFLLGE